MSNDNSHKLDTVLNDLILDTSRTLSEFSPSTTIQIVQLSIDTDDVIRAKISDGFYWVEAEISDVYKYYCTKNSPLPQRWAILSVSVSFIDTLASDTKYRYRYRYRWFSSIDTISILF